MGLANRKNARRGRAGRWAATLLALALLTLVSWSGEPASASTAAANPGHSSAKGRSFQRPAYWGAWIGDQVTGEIPPWDMRPVAQLEALLGKGMSLLALGSNFADCTPAPCRFFGFPTAAMENARAYGAIPFFNWSSQESSATPSLTTSMPDFQLADVLSGRYDSYIREFAEDARDWGHPFFLRFDWEMNGNWFPWSEQVNDNGPGEFVSVWRHVHDIFTAVGATNATWVWCPYAEIKRRFTSLAPLYPGSDYVNWTCMDGFNWADNPTNPHRWRSFGAIFAGTYRKLIRRVAPDKPIVLAEMASTGAPRAKARWIRNMFKQLATRYRRVRALIWFEQIDRGVDWQLTSSLPATRAFARGIGNPSFQGRDQVPATSPIWPPR